MNSTATIFENLSPQLAIWWPTIKNFGYLGGFVLVISGLVKMGSSGRQGGVSSGFKGGVYGLLSGVLLLNLLPFIGTIGASFMGSDANQALTGLSYSPASTADPVSNAYIRFAVYLVMLVGLVGVIKGVFLLNASQNDNQPLAPAFTHLIGGTIAINIIAFVKIISSSMGGEIESVVTKFLGS